MPGLIDLLEGFVGTEPKDLQTHINNRAKDLGLKLFLDDGEKNIFVPKARLDSEIVKNVELKKTIAEQQAEMKKVKDLTVDNEKAQQTIKDYETKMESLNAKMKENGLALALKLKASELKAIDESGQDLLKFIDKDKLVVNEDGSVTGLDEALTSLKASKSYLFKAEEVPGDESNAGNPSLGTGFPGRPPVGGVAGSKSQKPGDFGSLLSQQYANGVATEPTKVTTAPTYDFFK